MDLPRTIAEIIPSDGLKAKLALGRPLVVKLGIDPTSSHIHIGNAIGLLNARWFFNQGHIVEIIIGRATALIGDPTGRDRTRPQLSREQILENSAKWAESIKRIFSTTDSLRESLAGRLTISHNDGWLNNMSFADMMALLGNFTVQQMIERDSFAQRLASGSPINMRELVYPMLQAQDSVEVRADIELGGTDQLFNLMAGRRLMEARGLEPQVCVIHPLLGGIDGNAKMSKSLGNAIGVDDTPDEMFGKAMSIPDSLIFKFMELATDLHGDEIAIERNPVSFGLSRTPMDAKRKMARALVTRWHGAKSGAEAETEFIRVFSNREAPPPKESPHA